MEHEELAEQCSLALLHGWAIWVNWLWRLDIAGWNGYWYCIVEFNGPLDTLQVIVGTIVPATQLTGATTGFKQNETATKLQYRNLYKN